MLRRSALSALVALLVAAAPAGASRLDLSRTCGKYLDCNFVVRYTAAPGERNDVRVARSGQTLVVTDAGAEISASSSLCTSASHVVRCALPVPEPVSPIVLTGGDGDDRLDTTGMPSEAVLDGGPGDDVLTSGALHDTLTGGPGDDLINAASGTDTVSYADQDDALGVDLQAGTATTPSGERDVLAGVENVTGTGHDDTLAGDAASNVLEGNGGRDELRGRDGADTLVGGGLLRGGAGGDHMRPQGGGRVVCRRGDGDTVSARDRSAIVDATCRFVFMGSLRVSLGLGHHDPARDVIGVQPDLVGGVRDTITLHLVRGRRSLGRVHKRVGGSVHTITVHVRLNSAGRRVARSRGPTDVRFAAHQRTRRHVGGTITLRLPR